MEQKEKTEKGPLLGTRHLQVLLILLNKIILGVARSHISMTLVSMTDASKSNPNFLAYEWTEQQKSYILSSLFVGTTITTIPGAYFLRGNGAKRNLCIITLSVGIFNGLTPLCIHHGGWQFFCLLRFLQGLFQACANSTVFQHLANWAPPTERNLLSGFLSIGAECGIIAAALLGGFVPPSPLGWPGVFYVTTLLCFVWCVFWLTFGANYATTTKCISEAERAYIEASLQKCVDFDKKSVAVPWLAIFKSLPLWALVATRAALGFSATILQTELPAYINGVFKEQLTKNALITTLPFALSLVTNFLFLALADFIMQRKLLSLNSARKCFNTISMWIPAVALVWLGFLDFNQKYLGVALMMASVAFLGASTYGSSMTRIELAPKHTGTIVSIIDMTSNVVRMSAPLVVGAIVTEQHNQKQWQIVFSLGAAVLGVGDLIFLIWGTSKKQIWNDT